MDKLISITLPQSGKELIVLASEYSITEELNNTIIVAKQQAREMISKNNVKQITVGILQ